MTTEPIEGELLEATPTVSLRDYFAAAALQGVASSVPFSDLTVSPKQIAAWSWRLADAILEAREENEDAR